MVQALPIFELELTADNFKAGVVNSVSMGVAIIDICRTERSNNRASSILVDTRIRQTDISGIFVHIAN